MLLREYARYGASHGVLLENTYNNTIFNEMAGMSVEDALSRVQKIPLDATVIASHQKAIFKKLRGINNSSKDSSISKLNKDLISGFNNSDFRAMINSKIARIEQYILTFGTGKTVEKTLQNAKQYLSHLNQDVDKLLADTRLFFERLASYSNMQQISFAFKALDARLSSLQASVQSQLENNDIILPPPDPSRFLPSLIWTEYVIKGEYLEQVGKEYFKNIIPSNFKVLHTGRLGGYIDITGKYTSSGSMKADLMILDGKNFMIEFYDGQNSTQRMSIAQFIEYVDSRKSNAIIKLTEHSFHELHSHLVAGVQAKATRTEHIKFGRVNLLNGIKEDEGYALLALYLVHKAEKTKKDNKKYPLYTNHADYNALYNYNLAKNLNYVIGEKNTLLLTRNGLEDMNTFILKQFDKNRYFYGINYNLNTQTATVALDFN